VTSPLDRLALMATLHCLTGCAIGEVLGLVIGTALGWSDAATIALAVGLAFLFGYSFTGVPLLRSGLPWATVAPIALAADTVSIAVMEIVDNTVVVLIPGAMDAGLDGPLFWGALALALAAAFAAAYPVNRTLIARGRGHARVHGLHGAHGDHEAPASPEHPAPERPAAGGPPATSRPARPGHPHRSRR
jgi:Domain of unknown function (DUF4396)